MTQPSQPRRKRVFWIVPALIIAALAGVLLAVGGFAFGAIQESHDSFCASCHSQPETMFYQRSTAAQPVDLASFHTTKQTACINCHSGVGLSGRIQAELLGAHNAVLWYTGRASQPASLTSAISDQNCLKCHQDVTARGFVTKEQITVPGGGGGGEGGDGGESGRNNHWHDFLARWQAADPAAGSCVSCHSGHTAIASAQNGFMSAPVVQQECDACHKVLRHD